jgi:signal transduction histidine kinase/CheY-like chemotaxis protein
MTGYSREELIGRSILELNIWHDPEQRKRVVTELKTTGRLSGVDITGLNKRGETVHTIASGQIVRIDGKDYLLSFFFDITERRRLRETAWKAQKLESIGLLAGGIAHDFNNLLTGIFAFIDLARHKSGEPVIKDYLNQAVASIERAKALTFQLLTFSKGGEPIRKPESLPAIVQNAAKFVTSGRNTACEFHMPQNLWTCSVDRNQISQVIENIVINAVQAMQPDGTVVVSALNMEISEKQHPVLTAGKYVKISITDTGTGIPAEIMRLIFDPFFTTRSSGNGLGLATGYSIIKKHSGYIDVESQPGKGSTFNIFLPACPDQELQPVQSGIADSGSGDILIMDDEENVRLAISAMLTQLGYSSETTANGREAIQIITDAKKNGRKILAAILDLTVKGELNGIETAAEIRKIEIDMPLFVISGYSAEPVLANPVKYGFTDFIHKPFVISELSELLNKHLVSTPRRPL